MAGGGCWGCGSFGDSGGSKSELQGSSVIEQLNNLRVDSLGNDCGGDRRKVGMWALNYFIFFVP